MNNNGKEFEVFANPKVSPTLRGEDAKRLLREMENPPDNRELFEKCRESSKLFKIKK